MKGPAGSADASGGLTVAIEQQQPMRLAARFGCRAGELLALVGPSGAGKSSLLRVLAGLMRPQHGRVTVGAECWCDVAAGVFVPAQRRHVGLVFQSYALMPHLSAIDNVALSLLHVPRGRRRAAAARWLEHVRLDPGRGWQRPGQLSGGEQQRVAVARALARAPRLLLLDEPFSAVDHMNRRGLYRLLADLRHELAIPIVLVTHDLHEARMLADRLAVMDAGEVLQEGTPDELYKAPRNARVAGLVGIHNRFRGIWAGPAGEPGWGLLRWTAETGGEAAAGPLLRVRDKGKIQPQQPIDWVIPSDGIALDAADAADAETFAAEVTEARHLGEITLVTLRLRAPPGAALQLTLAGPRWRHLRGGTRVRIRLDTALVHVMPFRRHAGTGGGAGGYLIPSE